MHIFIFNKKIQFEFVCFLFVWYSLNAETFPGRTEPYNYSTISATIPGRISKIQRNVGSTVKKGDVILHLEKTEEELETARRKIIAESKVKLISAKQQVDLIKKDYEATKNLFDSLGSVSEADLWAKELEYRHAVAEYESIKIQERREELEYRIASAQLDKRYIYAPFSGEIVKVFLREGESCNAQEPLVKLVNVKKCRFISFIDPKLAQDLKKGVGVSLNIEGSKGPVIRPGKVEFVSSVVDQQSGLLEVRVLFDNSDKIIRPGGLAYMNIKD